MSDIGEVFQQMSDAAATNDCRNCAFNSYLKIKDCGWVSCSHPITLKKTPKWERGDPAFVNYRTGDAPISEIHNLAGCPTWQLSPQGSETPHE